MHPSLGSRFDSIPKQHEQTTSECPCELFQHCTWFGTAHLREPSEATVNKTGRVCCGVRAPTPQHTHGRAHYIQTNCTCCGQYTQLQWQQLGTTTRDSPSSGLLSLTHSARLGCRRVEKCTTFRAVPCGVSTRRLDSTKPSNGASVADSTILSTYHLVLPLRCSSLLQVPPYFRHYRTIYSLAEDSP